MTSEREMLYNKQLLRIEELERKVKALEEALSNLRLDVYFK